MSSLVLTLVPALILTFLSLRSAIRHSRNITYAPLNKPIIYLILMPLLGLLTLNYPFVERIVYAIGLVVYVRVVLQEFAYLEALMF
jgi:hypothetical protein